MAKKYDEEAMAGVRQAFEDVVLKWSNVTPKQMFGIPAYFANGTIFAALVTGGLALTRLDDEQRAAMEAQYPVRPFLAGEKLVQKWAVVPVTDSLELEEFFPFVEQSYRNAFMEEVD